VGDAERSALVLTGKGRHPSLVKEDALPLQGKRPFFYEDGARHLGRSLSSP